MRGEPMTQSVPGGAKKPPSFDEAFKTLEASEAEARAVGVDLDPQEAHPLEAAAEANANRDENVQIPPWFVAPAGFNLPVGKEVAFMRFRASWTDKPDLGDRQCVLWPLTVGDEKLALDRTMGKSSRALGELAQQSIRVIDGKRADWAGLWAKNPDTYTPVLRFWDEIGAKCRQMIVNWYHKSHALDSKELAEFFLQCFVVARVRGE
jgi:hypothetical protein